MSNYRASFRISRYIGGVFQTLLTEAKFRVYLLITIPHKTFYNIRVFRFGLPLIMKITRRTSSTEAHALRFLHSTGLNLPIPRLVDSYVRAECTYTIMSRLPGIPLIKIYKNMDKERQSVICSEVEAVMKILWEIKQPVDITGQVMMSASGDGLPDPIFFFEEHSGPFPSALACYAHVSRRTPEEFDEDVDISVQKTLAADPIVWVHTDLRMQNIFIKDGHVSGVIDWEDSGWYPLTWQIHAMRWWHRGCNGWWRGYWSTNYRFPAVSEHAYECSCKVLTYSVV